MVVYDINFLPVLLVVEVRMLMVYVRLQLLEMIDHQRAMIHHVVFAVVILVFRKMFWCVRMTVVVCRPVVGSQVFVHVVSEGVPKPPSRIPEWCLAISFVVWKYRMLRSLLQTISQLRLKIAPVKRARRGNLSVYSVVVFLWAKGSFAEVAMIVFLVVSMRMI